MMVASEAEDAWWPPTFSPSVFARKWLALWIMYVDSQSALRFSAARKGRRGSAIDDLPERSWQSLAEVLVNGRGGRRCALRLVRHDGL
jgi:hypothetical protein